MNDYISIITKIQIICYYSYEITNKAELRTLAAFVVRKVRKFVGHMKKFTRTKEDFTCVHCGARVKGNGYTNHCPKCLWSKHVDINPGDRAEPCGGMMKPVAVDMEHSEYIIIHKCQNCGTIKRCKMTTDDNTDALINLAQSIAKI